MESAFPSASSAETSNPAHTGMEWIGFFQHQDLSKPQNIMQEKSSIIFNFFLEQENMLKSTLCLDLGTHTGFCLYDAGAVSFGTAILATKEETAVERETGAERTGDIRYSRLIEFIRDKVATHQVKRLVFEDVNFASSPAQVQLWAALRTAIWQIGLEFKSDPEFEVRCVPVQTLKVFGAGSGKADKAAMTLALHQQYPQHAVDNDNEVDAIWLYYYTLSVDQGINAWSSIWAKRKAKAKARQEMKAQKREAKRQKLIDTLAMGVQTLEQLGGTAAKTTLMKVNKAVLKATAKEPFNWEAKGTKFQGWLNSKKQIVWKIEEP